MQRRKRNQKKKISSNITAKERALEKTWGKCAHCGTELTSATCTIDHIVPKSAGGTRSYYNTMPLCRKCNEEKADKDIDIATYYRYASKLAIALAISYKNNEVMTWDNQYAAYN